MIIQIIAWIVFVFSVLSILIGPFLIGKPREPTTAGLYIGNLIFTCLVIVLAGRVFGWW